MDPGSKPHVALILLDDWSWEWWPRPDHAVARRALPTKANFGEVLSDLDPQCWLPSGFCLFSQPLKYPSEGESWQCVPIFPNQNCEPGMEDHAP